MAVPPKSVSALGALVHDEFIGRRGAVLPKIYNEYLQVMNNMQIEYDGETKNGQLKDIQGKWDVLLEEKIKQLTK